MKEIIRKLVKTGRLEIVHGGWVSNDEACPTYDEIFLNFKVGHDFLLKEFSIKPTIAWHPD